MARAAVTSIDIEAIPVIDISPLGTPEGTQAVAAEMLRAAEGTGFFYVRNHGIPQATIDAVFGAAAAFFGAPVAEKDRFAVNPWHRGFIRVGEAKMYAGAKVDLKESFIWGDDSATGPAPDALGTPPNNWPDFVPGMRKLLSGYFTAANEVGWRLLRAFAAGLGIDTESFVRSIDRPTSRGSIIYYPPQALDLGDDQFGVSPHTDWGCLTLLYQDQTGGLEVQGRDGKWVTAHPIPGTFVVNVGDLLARWTNDRFKSTPHRVVNRSGRSRFSCAVFVDPNRDTVIAPVLRPGEATRYAPVTCGDYVQSRFDAAFAYRQKEAAGA